MTFALVCLHTSALLASVLGIAALDRPHKERDPNELRLQLRSVSLVHLVEEAISLAWDDRDHHIGVQVTYFLDRRVQDVVLIDERRVKQVLVSLLANAFRVTCTCAFMLRID